MTEQIALHLPAAGDPQQLELLDRLHALGGRDHVEARARPVTARDDRRAIGSRGDFRDERAVDLDLVEREHAQVAQRRIAGAEVVENDRHAQAP